MDVDGTTAVVTGAGSGIGRAVSHALAARGAQVVATDVDAARAATTAREITEAGGRAIAHPCDVTQLPELEAVRDAALAQYGRVDIVMNNVGVLAVGPVEKIPLEEWQRAIDINLMGIVRSNLVFLPLLIEQGRGHVVNTASTAGLLPYGYDRLPYTTTKHAIVGLSESLALYLRPQGVGVSCLCPAGVVTNIVEQMRFFGEATAPRGPALPIVEAHVVGELVADAIRDDTFLVLTAPEVRDEMIERATDLDAYLASRTAPLASGE
jgi:NAD(P)-dependent dehydrogenase (short-subunit alcohol dehydrogenase family)